MPLLICLTLEMPVLCPASPCLAGLTLSGLTRTVWGEYHG